MKPKTALRHFLAAIGCATLAISSTHAATVNWEGDTSNLWATADNWDTAPANSLTTDIANFNLATYGGNPVFAPTVGTATSINGITIGALNGTMTLTNTAALSIGNSGISIASGAGAFTISGSTTLGASQSWTNNSSNLLTFGAVTTGGNTLTIGGSGDTTASGNISGTNGALTKEGAGLLTLNAANGYTGATTINGGELRWGIVNAIAGGALNVNAGGTVNIQTFNDTVGTITIAKGGSITGTTGVLTTGGGGLVANDGGTISGFSAGAGLFLPDYGAITYNSTGPGSTTLKTDRITMVDHAAYFNIANGAAAVDFEITSSVGYGGNNIGHYIYKRGAGVMQFSGTETGIGGQNGLFFAIDDGTALLNKADGVAFIPGNYGIIIGDSAGSAGSAFLKHTDAGGNNQISNPAITINSDGLFDLNGKTETTSGAVTLNSTGQMDFNGGTLSVGAVTIAATGAGANTTPIKNTAGTGGLTVASLAITPVTGYTTSLSLGDTGTLTLGGDVTLNAAGTGRAQVTGSALSLGSAGRTFTIGLGTGADYDLLVGAGISGASRSLTKNGMGRLVLTGSNSYSGGTIVNAGMLQIGDGTTAGTMTSSGALTMGNAIFRVLAPASGGSSQTVGSLATSASTGSTVRLTPGASGDTTLTITGTGLSTGAGSSVNFDYTAGTTVGGTVGNNFGVWSPTLTAGIIGGAYTVTDSGGTGFATTSGGNVVRLTDPGSAGLPVTTGSATGSYFIGSGYSTGDTATPGSLVQALSGAVAAHNVTVNTTGLASGANLALGTNLLTLGAGMVFDGPNAYEISGSGAGGLRAALSGGTINLYNANTSTVTISAPIVANGASVLTVDGPGTTILSGTNTYTGATVVNGGTVRFSGTMAGSPITINNGAVAQLDTSTGLTSGNTVTFGAGSTGSLQLRGNNLTIVALNSNATLGAPVITNNNGGGAVANATLTINNASNATFGGVIQDGTGGGTLALAKSGSGTLSLSGVNTYTGGTVINAGAVSVTADANLGDAGGGITLYGGRLTIAGVNLNTTRNITVTGTGSSMVVNKNFTFSTSGALTGSGAITFPDPGGSGNIPIYNFSSSGNTYTGAMTLSISDVRVSSLGDAAGNNIVFTGAGSFSLNSSGVTAGLPFNNRAIELSNTSATVSNNNATHAITIGSNLVASGAAAKVLTLGVASGPTNVFSGNISDGSGGGTVGITKSGAGTWRLSDTSNSYTGTTDIQNGTLRISEMDAYGNNSSIGKGTSGTAIILGNGGNTGTLIYAGSGDSTDRTIQVGAGNSSSTGGGAILNNGSGTLTFTATTFNTAYTNTNSITRTLTIGGSNNGVIQGIIQDISGTNKVGVTKMGSGTWELTGAISYTGTTTVNGGTLEIKNAGTGRTQTHGGLTFGVGDGTLTSNRAGSGTLSTTFTALTRSAGATGNFISTGGTNGSTNIIKTTGAAGFMGRGFHYNNSEFAWREGTDGYVRGINHGVDGGTVVDSVATTNTHIKLTTSASRTGNIDLSSLLLAGDGVNYTINSGVSNMNGGIIKSGGGTSIISGAGKVGVSGNQELVVNTVASDDILEIGSQLDIFNVGVTKSGAGTLILSNANNSTSSPIYVNSGTLSVGANGNLGSQTAAATVHLRGGTLRATGTFGLFNGTAGTNNRNVTLANQSGIEVTGSNTLTIAGVISNNTTFGNVDPGFNKTGTGTLVLSNTNTYTGATVITNGTLAITGATQATTATSFTAGSLGLDTGFPVAASNAAVNLANGTITVTGSTGAASYTLLTAASITGTPVLAAPVPGYALQVVDGAADQLRLVQTGGGSPYDTWSGGAPFGGDANGDGVSNGLAFLLGATGPNVNGLNKLPTTSQTGGNLVMTFTCLATADRGSAALKLEYDGNLAGTWLSVPVPGAVGAPNPIVETTTTGSVSFVATDGGTNANGDALIHVVATISDATESASGKLFGRLKGTNP